MFRVKKKVSIEQIFSDPPLPYVVDLRTGEKISPTTGLPPGYSCGYHCPWCIEAGRDEDDSRVLFYERRPRKAGEEPRGHFQHSRKPPEEYPCYRKDWDNRMATNQGMPGAVERMLHWATKELIEWYFDGQCAEKVRSVIDQTFIGELSARTEKAYSGEAFIADVQILRPDGHEVNIEVVVSSDLGRRKGLALLTHPSQTMILNLKGAVDQAFLQPRLLKWHDLTFVARGHNTSAADARAETIATEVIEYLFLGDMVKEIAA